MFPSLSYVNFVPKFIKVATFEYLRDDQLVTIEVLFYSDSEGNYYVDQLCNNTLIYDHDPFNDFEDALVVFHQICDRFILC